MTATADVVAAIRSHRYRFATEADLQRGLAAVLTAAGIPFDRERRLAPGDIVDFWVDGLGVEVKVGGGLSDVTRQLLRYAGHDAIAGLLLVTSKSTLANLPAVIGGKPLASLVLRTGLI